MAAARYAGVPLRDVPEAASYADLRTHAGYNRACGSLNQHVT
jgi:hypothetical protein